MRDELPTRALAALLVTVAALLAPPGAADAPAQGVRRIFAVPTQVSLPGPGPADFDFEYVQYQGAVQLSVDVPGNSPWTVLASSDDPDLGGYGKSTEDLLYRLAGASVWNPASAVEQILVTGSGDTPIQIELAMAVRWDADPPDDYAGTLRFRLQAEE